jgi:hypothetical protein
MLAVNADPTNDTSNDEAEVSSVLYPAVTQAPVRAGFWESLRERTGQTSITDPTVNSHEAVLAVSADRTNDPSNANAEVPPTLQPTMRPSTMGTGFWAMLGQRTFQTLDDRIFGPATIPNEADADDPPRPAPEMNDANLEKFWSYIGERHSIRRKRDRGDAKPWTADMILRQWRFTNVFRELDPGTLFVFGIYKNFQHIADDVLRKELTIFNIIVYRIFNRIETMKATGYQDHRYFDVDCFTTSLKENFVDKNLPFTTGAHTVSSYTNLAKKYFKEMVDAKTRVPKYLTMPKAVQILASKIPQLVADLFTSPSSTKTMRLLETLDGVGTFLKYQIAVDCGYFWIILFDECLYVVAGPGCESGLQRLFIDPRGRSPEQQIKYLCSIQDAGLKAAGFDPLTLFNDRKVPKLNLMAIENCLCEFYKYFKALLPEQSGRPRNRFDGEAPLTTPRETTRVAQTADGANVTAEKLAPMPLENAAASNCKLSPQDKNAMLAITIVTCFKSSVLVGFERVLDVRQFCNSMDEAVQLVGLKHALALSPLYVISRFCHTNGVLTKALRTGVNGAKFSYEVIQSMAVALAAEKNVEDLLSPKSPEKPAVTKPVMNPLERHQMSSTSQGACANFYNDRFKIDLQTCDYQAVGDALCKFFFEDWNTEKGSKGLTEVTKSLKKNLAISDFWPSRILRMIAQFLFDRNYVSVDFTCEWSTSEHSTLGQGDASASLKDFILTTCAKRHVSKAMLDLYVLISDHCQPWHLGYVVCEVKKLLKSGRTTTGRIRDLYDIASRYKDVLAYLRTFPAGLVDELRNDFHLKLYPQYVEAMGVAVTPANMVKMVLKKGKGGILPMPIKVVPVLTKKNVPWKHAKYIVTVTTPNSFKTKVLTGTVGAADLRSMYPSTPLPAGIDSQDYNQDHSHLNSCLTFLGRSPTLTMIPQLEQRERIQKNGPPSLTQLKAVFNPKTGNRVHLRSIATELLPSGDLPLSTWLSEQGGGSVLLCFISHQRYFYAAARDEMVLCPIVNSEPQTIPFVTAGQLLNSSVRLWACVMHAEQGDCRCRLCQHQPKETNLKRPMSSRNLKKKAKKKRRRERSQQTPW